jgi:hypothetical protein
MADRLNAEVVDDIRALDKAIEDFIADLRQRASWDKSNVEDDGTVILPCGNGVLFRLGEARYRLARHLPCFTGREP